jgi:hypothetical protein
VEVSVTHDATRHHRHPRTHSDRQHTRHLIAQRQRKKPPISRNLVFYLARFSRSAERAQPPVDFSIRAGVGLLPTPNYQNLAKRTQVARSGILYTKST